MSSNSIKEPQEQRDGPVRNATFFASEYLLGAFALVVGFSLSVTVDREFLSLPKESLLELAIFAVTALAVIGLFWIGSALSFIGETQRGVLRAELDKVIHDAQELAINEEIRHPADESRTLSANDVSDKLAMDWIVDVEKHVSNPDANAIAGIVRYCGIALQQRDSALVSFTDKEEVARVRTNFLKRKLGLTNPDADLDKAIMEVADKMKPDRAKGRVTVYYLLADRFGKLSTFKDPKKNQKSS